MEESHSPIITRRTPKHSIRDFRHVDEVVEVAEAPTAWGAEALPLALADVITQVLLTAAVSNDPRAQP